MNKKPYYKASNWNAVEDQVDRSAWARLNDIVYEPRRVPIHEDRDEFSRLPKNEQTMLLHSFGSLTLSSTLQMKVALSKIKQDAKNSEEAAVYNALQYLESINNKAYSHALAEFSNSKEQKEASEWASKNPYLQKKMKLFNTVYQSGNPIQKKAAHIFLSTGLYHSSFFGPLYLFGQHKLPRTAELIKYALRITTLNGIYTGIKFRRDFFKLSKEEQKNVHDWVYDLCDKLYDNELNHIKLLYSNTGLEDKVEHYIHYTLNKALMNLGQEPKYPENIEILDPILTTGLMESAMIEDFFFYTNAHPILKMREIKK
ncbi:MAG: ribonucleotide-diphosphate reductase subunit beta [Lactobacillus sp.]|uniref:ribonucleotide-diphosphate reductase subunit beta n=1 Tax=Lactobacillus sp. TaxID=1591 RepID=UPI0023C22E07|nr:ribonucleotide-diphosphate reductase subunit beta [Lactobacillus sp.]MDE7049896.1 ribonucleotide-diphosphate reductase subunit beta [Lactobacillus sp.]